MKNPRIDPRQMAPNESFQSWRFGKRAQETQLRLREHLLHRRLDVHQYLRGGKEPHRHPDEPHPVEQIHVVKRKTGDPALRIDPHTGDQKADDTADEPLERRITPQRGDQGQPHERQGKILRRTERYRVIGQGRRKKVSINTANVPAMNDASAAIPRAGPGLPCLAI